MVAQGSTTTPLASALNTTIPPHSTPPNGPPATLLSVVVPANAENVGNTQSIGVLVPALSASERAAVAAYAVQSNNTITVRQLLVEAFRQLPEGGM